MFTIRVMVMVVVMVVVMVMVSAVQTTVLTTITIRRCFLVSDIETVLTTRTNAVMLSC